MILSKTIQPQENFCFYNDKTKERLLTKMGTGGTWKKTGKNCVAFLRYPLASKTKNNARRAVVFL
jgi:hypothetical protein